MNIWKANERFPYLQRSKEKMKILQSILSIIINVVSIILRH